MRQVFVTWHRYIGLVMVLFLVVAGVTGSMLAFYEELEALLHPDIMRLRHVPGQQPIDPVTLAEQVEQRYPQAMLNRIPLFVEAEKPMRYFLQPKTATDVLENNEIFVHPYTGAILAERKWGEISQGSINLLPFIYRLHFSLAADKWGQYLFGMIALLWTVDCFVGAYLTFPPRQKSSGARRNGRVHAHTNWWVRWKKSWQVRWGSGRYKVNFDLHRAGGLWVWAMLFVFAWSGVAFNLTDVYRPVMMYLLDDQPAEYALPAAQPSRVLSRLDKQAALARGRALMQQASLDKPFDIRHEGRLAYLPNKHLYVYSVNSSLDVSAETANTRVLFDAQDGHLLARYFPTGTASGNTVTEWLLALHTARVWGLPMQLFVLLMGVVVTGLSITGVYIWWKKRHAKHVAKKQSFRQGKPSMAQTG